MIILIDIDGPLADFYGEFLNRWKNRHPNLPHVKMEDRKQFDLKKDYPGELYELTKEIYTETSFTLSLPPNPAGIEAVKEIAKSGFDIFLCSSPLTKYNPNVLEKYLWVEKYIGEDFVKKLIVTRDKTIVRGDILIDDKPEIKGLMTPTWKQVLYDMPYNRQFSDMPRLKQDWGNWRELLLG